jgi:cell division protein FtsB
MLLNEVKKQHAQLSEQAARLEAQQREIDELRAQVRALIGGRVAVWE